MDLVLVISRVGHWLIRIVIETKGVRSKKDPGPCGDQGLLPGIGGKGNFAIRPALAGKPAAKYVIVSASSCLREHSHSAVAQTPLGPWADRDTARPER